jgi:hypothetical protein
MSARVTNAFAVEVSGCRVAVPDAEVLACADPSAGLAVVVALCDSGEDVLAVELPEEHAARTPAPAAPAPARRSVRRGTVESGVIPDNR